MKNSKEITITFRQLIALWCVVGVMMLLVFVFGLHAGLNEGLKEALVEKGTESLPLRIPSSALTAGEQAQPQDLAMVDSAPSAPGLLAQDGFAEKRAGNNEAADGFDFSGVTAPTAQRISPVTEEIDAKTQGTGLIGKSAQQIMDQKVEPSAAALAGDTGNDIPQRVSPRAEVAPEPEVEPKVTKVEEVTKRTKPTLSEDKPSAPVAVEKEKKVTKKEVAEVKFSDSAQTVTRIKPGMYVQVAAPTSKTEAAATVTRVTRAGLSARIQETRVGGALYFRVLIGPEVSRASAEAKKDRLIRSGVVGGRPFVKFFNAEGR